MLELNTYLIPNLKVKITLHCNNCLTETFLGLCKISQFLHENKIEYSVNLIFCTTIPHASAPFSR